MGKKERIIWIDQLKGFIFFLVILGHLSINTTLKSYIYSFHMPIYFLITGLNYNTEKIYQAKAKDYLIKLSTRMLVPYVWMQTTIMCVRFVEALIRGGEVPASRYIKGMLYGNSIKIASAANPLYFVLVLFLAEAALFFVIKLVKGNKTAVCAICILVLPLSLFTQGVALPWHLNVTPFAMFLIMLGNLLMGAYRANEEKIRELSNLKNILIAVLLLLIGAIAWYYNGRFSLHDNKYGKNFVIAMISALSTSTALALIFIRIPKIRFLSFVGKYTLFYLGTHKALITLARAICRGHSKEPIFNAVTAVVIFFALIPITMFFKKFAPFVLGIYNSGQGTVLTIGQVVCVLAATCVPYRYFLIHLKDGLLISTAPLTIVSVAAYFVLCTATFFLLRKVFTFAFLIEPKKSQN